MSDGKGPEVGVVHLVWPPLGLGPVEKFLRSYEIHPAGVDHRLLVLIKDGADLPLRERVERRVQALGASVQTIPDAGFDIGPYFRAAQTADFRFFCFLNSYSVIVSDDWLAKMRRCAEEPTVGVVGATGSYESPHSVARMAMNPYTAAERSLREREGGREISESAGEAGARGELQSLSLDGLGKFCQRVRRHLQARRMRSQFRNHFAPFPNPHIRTNAFLIRREVLLTLKFRGERTKMDSYRFESGRHGMTRQLLDLGWETVVVGRDGVGYRPPDWMKSRTYRSGDQENLLVADNRTRQYALADPACQAVFREITWGRKGMENCVSERHFPPAD